MFKKMAQNIAQSTGEIIGYGVLVTDEKGIIIGCSDERRIGASHPPSLAVIMENRPMTTSPGDAECLGNVLPVIPFPYSFSAGCSALSPSQVSPKRSNVTACLSKSRLR